MSRRRGRGHARGVAAKALLARKDQLCFGHALIDKRMHEIVLSLVNVCRWGSARLTLRDRIGEMRRCEANEDTPGRDAPCGHCRHYCHRRRHCRHCHLTVADTAEPGVWMRFGKVKPDGDWKHGCARFAGRGIGPRQHAVPSLKTGN